MQYINEETKEYPVSEYEIRQHFPNVSFPINFAPIHPFVAVQYTDLPEHDTSTKTVEEGKPEYVKGEWKQTWVIVDRPLPPVPDQVTKRQLKQALTRAGLRESVESIVAQSNQDIKDWWIESDCFERNHPVVVEMASLLNKTSEDIDNIFILAYSLK